MNPCIAIIDSNTLDCIALRNILWDIFNRIEVHVYPSVEAFIRDSNHHFVHFFVDKDILFTNVDEFELLKDKTTVLSNGCGSSMTDNGFRILDTTLSEQEIVSRLLHLKDIKVGKPEKVIKAGNMLSSREKDVLSLMIKGLINKEIADELKIATTTVIFHRNNICEKLKTRSIGKLTVFAVLSGIVDLNEI